MSIGTNPERFVRVVADRQRVCSCICPVSHGRTDSICRGFVQPGEEMVLERRETLPDIIRCIPCAEASL